MGQGQERRQGNSQRHATRARHTRALQSSIHVAILLRIFSSCRCICRCICEYICHCHCICICTCSCVSICACILHFSFNYVHLNPRPIRIFRTFVACNVVAAQLRSATERRDRSMATDCGIETNPSALWLLPLSLLLSLLFLTALAIPRHHCSPPPPPLFVCFHWRRVKWIQRN